MQHISLRNLQNFLLSFYLFSVCYSLSKLIPILSIFTPLEANTSNLMK
ncbi:hypothetical protein QW060_21260 [Myroides ceti]|uniref:ATP synthase F0 subunit 8 n=1 Tax=Paenimyroides ceti TaxID=395087 RepID=A0ABT8D215_9FLAO|nr:hypothetical protein [Paenimyroides ceti]MDN3709510.1 hypothetical protein [Paenimyroides ceti]